MTEISEAAVRVLQWCAAAEVIPTRQLAMRWGVTFGQALVNDQVVADVDEAAAAIGELVDAGYLAADFSGRNDQ